MKIPPERRRSIEGHIRHDDYFGTLAAILDLLRQDMEKSGGKPARRELLLHVRDDLLYLQDTYQIHQRYLEKIRKQQ